MDWSFDKIFVNGNIIGVKNVYKNKVFPFSVDEDSIEWLRNSYANKELSCKNRHIVDGETRCSYSTDFNVQYVVRLDENGNVSKRIFDRDKDMIEYPKLCVGTFGKILYFNGKEFEEICCTFGKFVIAKNGYISYENGGHDNVNDIINFRNNKVGVKLVETYDAISFDECDERNVIWRNPMYENWLNKKEQ